jgi:hypothetical protein
MSDWWRSPPRWWRGSDIKADDDYDGPPRGDFEQIIQDRLKPVFEKAQTRAILALTEGDKFDDAYLRDELIALFLPVLTNAVIFAVNELEGEFALGFEPDTVQEEARIWARQRAETLADQLIETTRGMLSGLEPEEIEDATDRAFGIFRMETIGASETTDSLSFGAILFKRLAAALEIFVDLFFGRSSFHLAPRLIRVDGVAWWQGDEFVAAELEREHV